MIIMIIIIIKIIKIAKITMITLIEGQEEIGEKAFVVRRFLYQLMNPMGFGRTGNFQRNATALSMKIASQCVALKIEK